MTIRPCSHIAAYILVVVVIVTVVAPVAGLFDPRRILDDRSRRDRNQSPRPDVDDRVWESKTSGRIRHVC